MGEGGYKQINKTLNAAAFEDLLSYQQKSAPRLPDVEQITPRVIRILGQNAGKFTLQGTNTYIVGTGANRLMIDTGQGYREWADLVQETCKRNAFKLSHVLLTHWHGDHTGGVKDLLRLYPELDGCIYKHSPEQGQQAILDGQVFHVEGATVRSVHSPGHSHDHMCFILDEENAMFTGDNVLGHGTSAVEELGTYMSTLKMLQARRCVVGYPAHGVVIPSLPAKIARELAQKVRREQQALEVLCGARVKGVDKGPAAAGLTVPELVVAMHGNNVAEDVRRMALEPFVHEVLRKLAADEKVAFKLQHGTKRWFAVA